LSFEHVPPRSAFNKQPVLYKKIEELISEENGTVIKGKTSQRGCGAYTLCLRCNNNTGAWYGEAYCQWAYQGMRFLNLTRNEPILHFNFFIFPLRIIKQILCMFCSANGDWFSEAWPS